MAAQRNGGVDELRGEFVAMIQAAEPLKCDETRHIAARGQRVSAFYISNIETYLYRDNLFARFVENVARLPHRPGAVIIRSVFGNGGSSTSSVDEASATMRLTSPKRLLSW